ncbi:hypothetical protein L1049_024785 [Liquidambar formosana]|uniref:Uncharacterized protein n=1 Tax=Liquidambar formosana TaxID=63359 RepID=A0AAP0S2J5_LIQFO
MPPLGVQLRVQHQQVVVDNGLVQVTLSVPEGMVMGIQYNGIDNLLDTLNEEDGRGYWDAVWSEPGSLMKSNKIKGTSFRVIMADENQIELSFATSWNPSFNDSGIPLNIDKRFIMLRGDSGFYLYAIYERLEGWPDLNIDQTRIVFKLQRNKFQYMALSDDRQRIMPMFEDREHGQPLAYPEAVLLTNPTNPALRGEVPPLIDVSTFSLKIFSMFLAYMPSYCEAQVDDKYQYSCDDKDNQVHGWICFEPPVGFWMITPSDEFRTAGPVKQDLTSHVGPITLS